jgi:hypothetical protein
LALVASALTLAIAAVVASAASARGPGASWRGDERYPQVETETRSESFRVPAGGRLVVDGFAGDVDVRAIEGEVVRVTVRSTWRARDAGGLERARREMPILLGERDGVVTAYVDAPFRAPDGSWRGVRSQELGYRVVHDVEVEVPRALAVELATVVDGDVELTGTDGPFAVSNVNGRVTLREVTGAGSARTVNGPLHASFRRNPAADCELATVNGDLTVELQPGLGADLRYRTLNGEAWSDFAFTLLPRAPLPAGERQDGRFRAHSRWNDGIRIGAGGPRLSLETLNGDILIRRR